MNATTALIRTRIATAAAARLLPALGRPFTTTLPHLKSSHSSKSKRHHPHHSPARTSPPHAHSTPRAGPVHPGAPRSAPLPGSNTAAAGPTGFVSSNAIASSSAAGTWWSAQAGSTKASLVALGVSGYLITAWVVYQALADKEDGPGGKVRAEVAENKVGKEVVAPASDGIVVKATEAAAVAPTAAVCQADHKHIYDELAPGYDWSIGWDELVMGLLLVRRWVISHAKGDTLELAAGTGRNTPYYRASPQVTSLTLTDTSIPMLDHAVRTHLTKTSPDGHPLTLATTKRAIPTRVLPADAHSLPVADAAFDTVISTFSLCSVHDPVCAVGEGIRVLKPGGSMWLVEHGRAKYAWLNRSLDENAVRHAEKWGCWYNRDIGGLVEEAVAQVGEGGKVRINRQYRLHFGTTWIIEVVKEA